MSTVKKVGVVGVDSGQVMICDPGYIDDEWSDTPDGASVVPPEVWKDKKTGKTYAYPGFGNITDEMKVDVLFDNWTMPLEDYDGKTPNEVREEHWERVELGDEYSKAGEFNYAGVCHTTLRSPGFGQLKYKMGHDGVGVVSRTMIGDGCYPVFARMSDDGSVEGLAIDFRIADYDGDVEPDDIAKILVDPGITSKGGMPKCAAEIMHAIRERDGSVLMSAVRRMKEAAKMLQEIFPEMEELIADGYEEIQEALVDATAKAIDAGLELDNRLTVVQEAIEKDKFNFPDEPNGMGDLIDFNEGEVKK